MKLMEKWPNFFIVGAAKAGSTSLFEYLKDVPGIFMSPMKEPNYYNKLIIPDDYPMEKIRNKTEYQNLFSKVKNEKIIGEASSLYLTDSQTPELIYHDSPNAKIIICLRDPVERAFSHFLMEKKYSRLNILLETELQIELKGGKNEKWKNPFFWLPHGLYAKNVNRFLNVFGTDSVKIIIFEDFIKNISETMNNVIQFLGINYAFKDTKFEVHNPYVVSRSTTITNFLTDNKGIKKIIHRTVPYSFRKKINNFLFSSQPKPKLNENARKLLIDYYNDDVIDLKKSLKKELPWKNFN